MDLAPLTDSADLIDTVAAAVGGPKQSTSEPLAQLCRFLHDTAALIILDNCEHVLEACAVAVDRLLRAAPRLRVLATSRQTLRVHGEHVFDVPPMPVPEGDAADSIEDYDSVALLVARATDINPGFALTDDNREAVARLCRRLDGIPLAIELAAARLRALSVSDVVARLEHRFELLSYGSPAAVPRQQTLQAMVDWSFALCSPEQQSAWARLSVFRGTFDLEAAEAIICGDGLSHSRIADVIDELVDRSVILAKASDDGRVRYRMLETLREYGRFQLAHAGVAAKFVGAHRDFYLHRAEQSDQQWSGPTQATWLAAARLDHANMRAAFEHSLTQAKEPDKALTLAACLRWFWIASGNFAEGRRWFNAALNRATENSSVRAKALCVDAFLAVLQGDLEGASSRLVEIQTFCSDLPPDLRAYVAEVSGMIALFRSEFADAVPYLEDSLSGYLKSGQTSGEASVRFQLALAYTLAGQSERAKQLCDSSLQRSEETGERWGAHYALYALALERWLCNDSPAALDYLRRSFVIAEEFSEGLAIAHVTELAAWILASNSSFQESAVLLGVARKCWNLIGTSISFFGPDLAQYHREAERKSRVMLGDKAFDAALAEGARGDASTVSRAIGIRTEVPPPERRNHSGLTAREEQVVELVGKGMSNREISQALVLSIRTVESHVQHILTKLGFDRRAQVAAWIVERSASTKTLPE
ncbi:hypothetical protein AU183_04470 [Mycolicibacterium novocastrense]|nr:hypothetical protein AU183_04470 [Mycolicibacterium novocastrense]KUH74377.1 hypothetical protein AU072_17285 [Mycolicibacterium novocastrense]